MKKISLILAFLFAFASAYSQTLPPTPGTSPRSNASVIPEDYNLSIRSILLPPRFADTTAANTAMKAGFDSLARIIFTYDVMGYWGRVNPGTGKRWERLGSSTAVNIYTSDGNLTGDRILNGGGTYSLLFNNLSDFQVSDAIGTNRLQVSNVRTKLFSPLQTITFEVGDSARLTGIPTSASTNLFFPLVNPFTGAITKVDAANVGVNIYNSDGTLAGDRTVSGATNTLAFNNLGESSGLTIDEGGGITHFVGFASVDATIKTTTPTSTAQVQASSNTAVIAVADATFGNYLSSMALVKDSITWNPHQGRINIDSLASTSDSTNFDLVVRNRLSGSTKRASASLFAGSSASSLAAVVRVGNTTDSVIYTGADIAYQPYGLVYSDAFARSSFGANYVTAGAGSTFTFPGSAYLNITGNANSYSNLFARTDSTQENKGAITTTIVINTKAADSYGFAVGWGNLNTISAGLDHHVYGGVSLTTGTNNLFITAESSNLNYLDGVSLSISNGDTIRLTLTRLDWVYTVSYYNFRTKVKREFSLTGLTIAATLPFAVNGFSRPVFVHLGGDMKVINFARVSLESKNAKNVFVGNSLYGGGNISDPSQRMPYLTFNGNHADVIISAGGGNITPYDLAVLDEDLLRYTNAENYFLMCGGNDTAFSVWTTQGKAAYVALRNALVAAGKRVIHTIPTPRDAVAIGGVAADIIAMFPSDPIANFYGRFQVGGQLPADIDAGDGVHWSNNGNRIIAAYLDSLLPQYTTAIAQPTGTVKGYRGDFEYLTGSGIQTWSFTLTAQTVYPKADIRTLKIDPASTLAAMTIQLPYDAKPGYEFYIEFGGQMTSGVVITALTMTADATQQVVKAGFVDPVLGVTPFPWGVGDKIFCQFDSTGTWYLTPLRTFQYTDFYSNGLTWGKGKGGIATNTAGGYAALYQNTSGQNNSAFGTSAGTSITTGQANTAIGSESMLTRTTVSQGTALGYFSGRTGGGIDFTAVGYAAVSAANASAARVTGVGSSVMGNVSSGTDNSAFGYAAGGGITTGSFNTIVGANINGFATTETGTLAIGANSLRRIWANGRGQIILGGSIPNTGGVGVDTTSRGATVTANGTFRIETAATVTTVDSLLSIDGGLVGKIDGTNWARTASTGLTNTSGTWTANLSTGVSGGQSLVGGTAANDQLIVRGSVVASGSTVTNPDVSFIVGDGAGSSAFQLLKNTTAIHYGSVRFPIRTITTTASAGVTDKTILGDATGGSLVVNLPTAASAFSTNSGTIYIVKKIDASVNTVTITAAGADLIDGAASQLLVTQYSFYAIQSNGTNWFIVGQ
jgi:hypothetical protein